MSDCDPIIKNKDIKTNVTNVRGVKLEATDPAIPCGLVAKSVFTDTYNLTFGGSKIAIDETGIAWESDIEYKFKNIEINLPTGKEW